MSEGPPPGRRIVFFGSAAFSLPALRALCAGPDEVVLTVTAPPAPAGRGQKPAPTPPALFAAEKGLELLESRSARSPEIIERIAAARPDFLVVAAFGGFLPEQLLRLCPSPPLNIHPSLLPRHRGPAPVNWALMQGDRELGVSIIFLDKEMDAGPILSQRAFSAAGAVGAGLWEARLAEAGAEELLKVIAALKEGNARPRPQAAALATVNRLLRKADGRIDWRRLGSQLAGLINGVDPWPGAQTSCRGRSIKLFEASPAPGDAAAEPGRVLGLDGAGALKIAALDGEAAAVRALQPEGKKRLTAADFIRGYKPEIFV
ncbi:MAG: methionyl-tRNA formyltransferase [Candidatus Adiutrix sp.]|jgi:methionyl-tRNA formyltransferase|nr:methionyl-tRNA formyltransferase [Candidatus Adiutrix sp.]